MGRLARIPPSGSSWQLTPVARSNTRQQKVIGLAGHIDHGKTALVKALTGVDTDRLAEEKRRGVTIDIGIAFFDEETTLIDVPGHERFIKNMVTGVSTVDLALLVIAADDGIMPQTREHLDILRLLGVERLLVALNKIDLVEEEWLELVGEETRGFLAEYGFPDVEILPVSAMTGAGVPELRASLEKELKNLQGRRNRGLFRLPIDRVFQVKGFGTVVTGTVLSHELKSGQNVQLYPQGENYTVRGLQSHHQDVDRVRLGDRAALNLAGASVESLGRGNFLGSPGMFRTGTRWLGQLEVLPHWKRPVREADRVHVHVGTGKQEGRLHLLEANRCLPGQSMLVQVRFEHEVAAAFGERTILRFESPEETLGGIRLFWETEHRLKKQDVRLTGLRDLPDRNLEIQIQRLLAFRGRPFTRTELASHLSVAASQLQGLLQEETGVHSFQDKVQLKTLVEHARRAILDQLQARAGRSARTDGLTEAEFKGLDPLLLTWVLGELQEEGVLQNHQQHWRLNEEGPGLGEEEEALHQQLRMQMREQGYAPPALTEIRSRGELHERVCRWMIQQGELVQIDKDFFLLREEVTVFIQSLRTWFRKSETLSIAEAREFIPTTRKYMLPLLNYAEKKGFVLRRGDVRVWIGEKDQTPPSG